MHVLHTHTQTHKHTQNMAKKNMKATQSPWKPTTPSSATTISFLYSSFLPQHPLISAVAANRPYFPVVALLHLLPSLSAPCFYFCYIFPTLSTFYCFCSPVDYSKIDKILFKYDKLHWKQVTLPQTKGWFVSFYVTFELYFKIKSHFSDLI